MVLGCSWRGPGVDVDLRIAAKAAQLMLEDLGGWAMLWKGLRAPKAAKARATWTEDDVKRKTVFIRSAGQMDPGDDIVFENWYLTELGRAESYINQNPPMSKVVS